ncbi:hypothetical protein SLS61_003331 [Didymella pomorum]
MSEQQATQVPAAATTPQQQPMGTPTQQNAPTPASVANAGGDQLTCQWQACGERLPSAEQLYRDHITSHIRVHVPLKPHKCDFCGKAFKRPQDLKKHVKTHADDSVLLRSPEPNRGGPHGASGYPGQSGKLVADLQALAATASGYQYPEGALGQGAYGQQHPGGAPAGFYGGPPQNSAYGPVYYAVNQTQQLTNDYEIRKRAAYDALNEFFGDAKRRAIDPSTYYDVGQRLMGLQGVQLPVLGGYQSPGMSEYGHGGTMVAQASHPPMHHPYSLPLPNLRTKSDLLNIDQFLEQLQSTVYENPNHAAAAGVQQAGAHYVHTGAGYRSSHSPPGLSSSHSQSSHATAAPNDTPALTPASSVLSYSSQHSPGASHSSSGVSPTSRSSIGSMYPTLPSVSAMSDMSAAAPSSGLAPAFDADGRRRFSGNLLQKAAPGSGDEMDTGSDGSNRSRRNSGQDDLHHDVNQLAIHSPKVDPALRSPSVVSDAPTETPSDSQNWVENIRVIERLRAWLKERLDTSDYADEDEDSESKPEHRTIEDEDEHNLYPVLRAVQEGRE